jgi:hypothetical protein
LTLAKKMSQTFLNLLTTEDISGPETGRDIGELILRRTPAIFPEKIGNWEPIKDRCVSADDFVRYWQWPVLAKRRKPRSSLSVWFRKPHRRYSSVDLDVTSGAVSAEDLTVLLAELGKLIKAEVGMIQDVTPEYEVRARDKELLRFTDKLKTRFYLHLYDESVADGMPDAFDTMWLPAEMWIVAAPKLLAPMPGIFRLPETEFCSRDEVLKQIRKRG